MGSNGFSEHASNKFENNLENKNRSCGEGDVRFSC